MTLFATHQKIRETILIVPISAEARYVKRRVQGCSNEKTVNSFSCVNGLTIFDVSTQTCNFAFQDAVQGM